MHASEDPEVYAADFGINMYGVSATILGPQGSNVVVVVVVVVVVNVVVVNVVVVDVVVVDVVVVDVVVVDVVVVEVVGFSDVMSTGCPA